MSGPGVLAFRVGHDSSWSAGRDEAAMLGCFGVDNGLPHERPRRSGAAGMSRAMRHNDDVAALTVTRMTELKTDDVRRG